MMKQDEPSVPPLPNRDSRVSLRTHRRRDGSAAMWVLRSKPAALMLTKEAKAELEVLRAKALEGKLKDEELDQWRKRGGRASDGLKTFLSKVLVF